jgi:hypothetical protein
MARFSAKETPILAGLRPALFVRCLCVYQTNLNRFFASAMASTEPFIIVSTKS